MHHVRNWLADGPRAATSRSDRFVGIDALRGVAALAVCLFHWEHIAFGTPNQDQWFRLGALGVELFFVISGFVILMVADRVRSIGAFVLARIVRLYPAYLASVALTALYVLWVQKYGLATVLVNVSMLQSFVDVPNIANPYWTLAFEITFYGLLMAVLCAGTLRHIAIVALAWLVATLLYRLMVPGPLGFDESRPFAQLGYILVAPQFAPFFVIGMMVYRLGMGRLGGIGAVALTAALGLTLFGRHDFIDVSGLAYAGFAGGIALAVWEAARGTTSRRSRRPVAWLGLVSYPLYLVHCTVANLCVTMAADFALSPPPAVAVSIPLSLGLAVALHYGLERPVTAAWRRAAERAGAVHPAARAGYDQHDGESPATGV